MAAAKTAERGERRFENVAGAPGGRESAPGGAERMLRIGTLRGAHGLHGALRFRPDNPDSELTRHLTRLFVAIGGELRQYRLLRSGVIGHGMIKLVLEGVTDANQADALKGAGVMVAEGELPPLSEHEFYYYRLIGCEVVLTDGRSIGIIEEIFPTGANDVLVVREGNKEVLIPAIADVVKVTDLAARRVIVEPVPGLLD